MLAFVKWLVWGWWHGESISAYDSRRTTQGGPGFEIGEHHVSWSRILTVLLALAVIGGFVYGLTLVDWRQFSWPPKPFFTERSVVTDKVTVVDDCRITWQGRHFVDEACLDRQQRKTTVDMSQACAQWLKTTQGGGK